MSLGVATRRLTIEHHELERLLQSATVLAPDDRLLLQRLVDGYREVLALLDRNGNTLQRLRALFGLRGSEKTDTVLPEDLLADDDDDDDDEEDDAQDPALKRDDDGEAPTSDGPADSPEQRRRRRKKGHGRIPGARYGATPMHVPHPNLKTGSDCPCCSGTLYPTPPSPTTRIFAQPIIVAKTWHREQLRCGTCGRVQTAPAPDEARGPKYDDEVAAILARMRYGNGMPHHRLAKYFANTGIPLPPSTQYEILKQRRDELEPVLQALKDRAANSELIHTDDTSMKILEVLGRRRSALEELGALDRPDRTGVYTTAILGISGGHQIALYVTGRQHAGENLADLLGQRDPRLPPPLHMCDGLDHNRPANHEVVELNCVVHGRRNVLEALSSYPEEGRRILLDLRSIFRNERTTRKQDMSPERRLLYHQAHSKPVLDELRKWMQARVAEKLTEPNSSMGKAMAYLEKRWDALTAFLRVKGAPLDNNICERLIKKAIPHRKGSLFYRSLKGAAVGDGYMSLLTTAELHGIDATQYLTALLRHSDKVREDPEAWLPWNYQAALDQLMVPVV